MHPMLTFPHCVHRSVLYVRLSIAALQVGSWGLDINLSHPSLLGILKDTPRSEDSMIWTSTEVCMSLRQA